MTKKALILVVILIGLGVVFLNPSGDFQKNRAIKKIEENLDSISSRIDSVEKTSKSDKLDFDSFKGDFNSLAGNFDNASKEISRFYDRYQGTDEGDFVGQLVEQLVRFDAIFVSKIIPSLKSSPDLEKFSNNFFVENNFLKNLTNVNNLTEQLRNSLNGEGYIMKEFRLAEIMNSAFLESSSVDLSKFKEDLLLYFAGRLGGASTSTISSTGTYIVNTPGDLIGRLSIFDKVRESVLDSNLKTGLNIFRQKLLEKAESKINREISQEALRIAGELISNLRTEISNREGNVSVLVNQSLERAEFHLKQATSFEEKQNFVSAFGQATAAAVAAEEALFPFVVDISEYKNDIEFIKSRFDYLLSFISERNGLGGAGALVTKAEEEILKVSRILETNADASSTFVALRNLKILMGAIEQYAWELGG